MLPAVCTAVPSILERAVCSEVIARLQPYYTPSPPLSSADMGQRKVNQTLPLTSNITNTGCKSKRKNQSSSKTCSLLLCP